MDGEAVQAGVQMGAVAHPNRHTALPNIVMVFGVVTIALMLIFQAAGWYAKNVSLRRYCGETDASLALVQHILSGGKPAGTEATRPYVIAAKLIYLVPQRHDEPAVAYLARLRSEIESSCR